MARTVEVRGADKVENRLRGMGRRAQNQRPVMMRMAKNAAQSITNIARDTGALEQSVRRGAEWDGDSFIVKSDVPYSRFVFYGTQFIEAQPPHVPSGIGLKTAKASLEYITA